MRFQFTITLSLILALLVCTTSITAAPLPGEEVVVAKAPSVMNRVLDWIHVTFTSDDKLISEYSMNRANTKPAVRKAVEKMTSSKAKKVVQANMEQAKENVDTANAFRQKLSTTAVKGKMPVLDSSVSDQIRAMIKDPSHPYHKQAKAAIGEE